MIEKMLSEEGWHEKIIQSHDGVIVGYANSKSTSNFMIIFGKFNGKTGWLKFRKKIIIPEISYHNGVEVPKKKTVYDGDRSYHIRKDIPSEEGILSLLREEEKNLRMNFFRYLPD